MMTQRSSLLVRFWLKSWFLLHSICLKSMKWIIHSIQRLFKLLLEISSPLLCQSFAVYAWVFGNTRLTALAIWRLSFLVPAFRRALRPVLRRVALRHTVLSWALHLGHVGTLPSAACVWNRALCREESSIIRAVFYLKTVTWAAAILRGFDASQHSSLIEVIRPPTNF